MNKKLSERFRRELLTKINEEPEFAENLVRFVFGMLSFPENIREFSESAASLGWFLTSEIVLSDMKQALDESQECLDNYMVEEMTCNYIDIKKSLIKSHPEREHILSAAFYLHEQDNWIASIPLFLSQTEGIFSENVGAMLFSEHEQRKERLKAIFDSKAEQCMLFLSAPFETKNQFSAGISSASDSKKRNGPNRNGIMHGSRKHLDYGTKVNSFKCISLLSFVSSFFEGFD
ncbi:hypothetical protein [Shewanella sp. 10B]|uniref:hypothetical protein n=1 Tax=Shewanella sp. 10B TaxID=2943322 RepID=UPI00201A8426|nr:hypothetical protein [Shewanella sp. 10B]